MPRKYAPMRERRFRGLLSLPGVALLVFLCALAGGMAKVEARPPQVAAQDVAGQEACVGNLTESDVFSVGEVRTSILSPADFSELNGPEWVLMDGRPLAVQTALSPHLSETDERGLLLIPDARGRFLRMVNNNACALLHADAEAHRACFARHDPDGDRLSGSYQPDALSIHTHTHENADLQLGGMDAVVVRPGNRLEVGYVSGFATDSTPDISSGPQMQTGSTGDRETRPKNIGVNYFVKICLCRSAVCK